MDRDLFGQPYGDSLQRSAVILDKLHRVELRRVWNDTLPMLVVCMLNPSDADHEREDPTLHVLIYFAKFWGFGGLLIVNLYSYRTSKPAEMFAMGGAAIHVENERYVNSAVVYARDHGGQLLAAWGNDGQDRAMFFTSWARQYVDLICLGTTQSGAPKHPMARGLHRIPRNQQPVLWQGKQG
jgi:hypothetical protein